MFQKIKKILPSMAQKLHRLRVHLSLTPAKKSKLAEDVITSKVITYINYLEDLKKSYLELRVKILEFNDECLHLSGVLNTRRKELNKRQYRDQAARDEWFQELKSLRGQIQDLEERFGGLDRDYQFLVDVVIDLEEKLRGLYPTQSFLDGKDSAFVLGFLTEKLEEVYKEGDFMEVGKSMKEAFEGVREVAGVVERQLMELV